MHSKVYFCSIYWMSINFFNDVYLWVSIWNKTFFFKNTVNCAIIYPFRVISKLGWYWNKLKNANEMNVCKNESMWSITWNFSKYYWLAKWAKQILKQHLHRYPYKGCKLCTQQCECVVTKIYPSQRGRYLGTCVLAPHWMFHIYLVWKEKREK